MYTTYITEALICGSRNSNTSDRSYLLFSRDAGMVWATARSVREERSKQRYALQEFSHVRATLIRGKGGWRIAGVEPIANLYFEVEDRSARRLLCNTLGLLRRTMQGETPHQIIFDDVVSTLKSCGQYDTEALELLLSLRILRELGYVAPRESYRSVLDSQYAYEGLTDLTEEQRGQCRRAIDEALTVSQL